MPSAGFEPAIPATKRPQTYSWEGAAIGIGLIITSTSKNVYFVYITLLCGIKIERAIISSDTECSQLKIEHGCMWMNWSYRHIRPHLWREKTFVSSVYFWSVMTLNRSRGNSVSIMSDYGLADREFGVRSPAGTNDFSSNLCVQTGSEAQPASFPRGQSAARAWRWPLAPI
jgi:hypothetical protein